MRKYGIVLGAIAILTALCMSLPAEITDIGESAKTDFYFTYQTNWAANATTLTITNRFEYPWQFVSIVFYSADTCTNTSTVAVIEVDATVYKQADVVQTNDWGLVETNNYGTITNIAYAYNTNVLIKSTTCTNANNTELYSQNLAVPYLLPADYYIVGGDVIRFTRTYTNVATKLRFSAKR